MTKIFVASFSRSSDGALSKLIDSMRKSGLLTTNLKTADYIMAIGDRKETFDFVLEQYRKNTPIIHLWAGEISQGTHDEVYRHSMTLMSMMQLCTNREAKRRVENLCRSIGKRSNAYVIGNIMLDNLQINNEINIRDIFGVDKGEFDLILYNPPTLLTKEKVMKELEEIEKMKKQKYIWIESNGDFMSSIVNKHSTHHSLPRDIFLRLLQDCGRFITNSSCQYYEAPFLMERRNIVSVGERNISRESRFSDMTIKNATSNVIKILERL